MAHAKKKINGKWVKPCFSGVQTHKIKNRLLSVRTGTQMIDRTWGTLRSSLRSVNCRVGSEAFALRVRSVQWGIWHRGQNKWTATGQMLKKLYWP